MPVGPRIALGSCPHQIRLPLDKAHECCHKCRLEVWGLEGLCTAQRRCTDCVDVPDIIFGEVKKQCRAMLIKAAGRRRQAERQKALKAQQAAQQSTSQPQLPKLNTVDKPLASSTPRQDDDLDSLANVSLHSSDMASCAGLNLTEVMNVLEGAEGDASACDGTNWHTVAHP